MRQMELNSLYNDLHEKYDVFIASSSFEERSLSVANSILDKISFANKFVVAELNNRECLEENINAFEQKGFEVVNSDNLDQLFTVDNFLIFISRVLLNNPNSSFLIDISTFTRQNLLILVRLLRNNLEKSKNHVRFLYSVASDYAIGLQENEKWLSRGVMSVQSVFGYAGTMLPSKNYHLIILMGYEVERALSLIDAYEPSKVTIGFASRDSSLSDEHYLLNKSKYQSLLEHFPFAEQFEFSCSNSDSIDTILEQAKKYPEYNVVVSPMNNKVSTLYLAAASFINTNIQVAIAIPMIYNYTGYSAPSNNCLILDLEDNILK